MEQISENIPDQEQSDHSIQYECDFVPQEGGVSSVGIPAFELFVPLLMDRGLSDIEIDAIKKDYDRFINAV